MTPDAVSRGTSILRMSLRRRVGAGLIAFGVVSLCCGLPDRRALGALARGGSELADFWEAAAISSGSGFAVLWGIPFVLIGLYMIFGRFIYKASRKRRTTYAVTDRRVMATVRGRSGESVEATYLRSIPNISTSAVAGGRGSVEFGLSSPMSGWYGNSGMEFLGRGQMASSGVSFFDIEDPRGVADLVERLREADRRA